jgi:hypothetical protein
MRDHRSICSWCELRNDRASRPPTPLLQVIDTFWVCLACACWTNILGRRLIQISALSSSDPHDVSWKMHRRASRASDWPRCLIGLCKDSRHVSPEVTLSRIRRRIEQLRAKMWRLFHAYLSLRSRFHYGIAVLPTYRSRRRGTIE